jgi:hypothetical protein
VADYTPVYASGVNPMTKTASAAITGGQVVESTTTGSVGPAGAASIKVVGVAANDTASGGRVTVWPLANIEHEVLCTGTITVGDGVVAGAAGPSRPRPRRARSWASPPRPVPLPRSASSAAAENPERR